MRGVKESSDAGVELEQASESVATADGTALGTQRYAWRREEDKVTLTLVVSFQSDDDRCIRSTPGVTKLPQSQ